MVTTKCILKITCLLIITCLISFFNMCNWNFSTLDDLKKCLSFKNIMGKSYLSNPSHLPGIIILEKPNFRVMETPWENTDEYSLLICSMSPCNNCRDTAKPKINTRFRVRKYRHANNIESTVLQQTYIWNHFLKLSATWRQNQ